MAREDVLALIKRCAAGAALPYSTCCHKFSSNWYNDLAPKRRHARARPADSGPQSPRTTKLDDRTQDRISLDKIERIRVDSIPFLAHRPLTARRHPFSAKYPPCWIDLKPHMSQVPNRWLATYRLVWVTRGSKACSVPHKVEDCDRWRLPASVVSRK
jgi:hypothetical protein